MCGSDESQLTHRSRHLGRGCVRSTVSDASVCDRKLRACRGYLFPHRLGRATAKAFGFAPKKERDSQKARDAWIDDLTAEVDIMDWKPGDVDDDYDGMPALGPDPQAPDAEAEAQDADGAEVAVDDAYDDYDEASSSVAGPVVLRPPKNQVALYNYMFFVSRL